MSESPRLSVGEWFAAHRPASGVVLESVVIGAGQAGLSAAYELKRRGIDFAVFDSNEGAGGAWQHRWDSLTMDDVHGVADLPGSQAPAVSSERSNQIIPAYFAEYEESHQLPVFRPVRVLSVESAEKNLLVHTSEGDVLTQTLVNATGTWDRPFIPRYPGAETFSGEQFHASTYPGPEYLAGKRVLLVGGGASAMQFLGELAYRSELLWVTRRPPQWVSGSIDGLKAVEWVEERAVSGAAPTSVVSSTGLFLRPQEQYARKMGVYEKRLPMFARIEPDGIRWGNGDFEKADVILWATGFRPAISHLASLHLRSVEGGIALQRVTGDVQGATTAVADPRVQLVGYGPSASTIGARHAARRAAMAVIKWVGNESNDS